MLSRQKTHLPFPKISGKYREFLSGLRKIQRANGLPPTIEIEGTVKLHGAHADIVYSLDDDDSFSFPHFQSRNHILHRSGDCHGWPCSLTRLPSSAEAFSYLKERILSRFTEINPHTAIDKSQPLVVAGEWIGADVQRNVALEHLTKRFVIIAININGSWQKDEDYGDIEAARAGIYSIFRAQQVKLRMDTKDLTENNPILFEMQRLADAVEANCPFATAFGVKNGRGEGVVWKPGLPKARADPRCWLKTKGPISGLENRIDATNISQDRFLSKNLDALCGQWLTTRRVEQGFEYLNEMGFRPVLKSLIEYRKWMVEDIMTEEKEMIEKLQSTGVIQSTSTVESRIEHMATDAYFCEAEKSDIKLIWKNIFRAGDTGEKNQESWTCNT